MHLRFDCLWAAYNGVKQNHPQQVMRDLGINYQHATPQSIADQWWVWNCENVPNRLPPFLEQMNNYPMACIGFGLSKAQAKEIMRICKKKRRIIELRIRKHLRNIFYGSYTDSWNAPLKRNGSKWTVSERIIEYPFVHREIVKLLHKGTILDVGCSRSVLPIELANLGYKVTGIDLRDYNLSHPNFNFIKADFTEIELTSKYDIVVCVSVYEHVGLGAYGEKADAQKIKIFRERLINGVNDDGYIIITVPLNTIRKDFIRNITLSEIKEFGKIVNEFYWNNTGCFIIKTEG